MTKRNLTISFMLMAGAILLALTLTPRSLAQQSSTAPTATPPKFALLEFIKIEPGKNADYRKDERDVWMPIHRERIKAGAIKSWWQWIVRYPGGVAREYDVVLITTFDKFTDLETPYPPAVLANFVKEHPDKKLADVMAYTGSLRKMVRSEVVQVIDSIQPTALPKFMSLSFMKTEPGKGPAYVEVSRKYWKPLWQERINRGGMCGWVLTALRFPGGSDREYSHVSADFYDKFEQMEALPAGILEKVHPGIQYADISAQTNAARRQVRTELLSLGDYVQ